MSLIKVALKDSLQENKAELIQIYSELKFNEIDTQTAIEEYVEFSGHYLSSFGV